MPPKVKEGKQSNVRQPSPKKGATAQTPKGKNPVPPRRKKQTLTNGDSTSSTQKSGVKGLKVGSRSSPVGVAARRPGRSTTTPVNKTALVKPKSSNRATPGPSVKSTPSLAKPRRTPSSTTSSSRESTPGRAPFLKGKSGTPSSSRESTPANKPPPAKAAKAKLSSQQTKEASDKKRAAAVQKTPRSSCEKTLSGTDKPNPSDQESSASKDRIYKAGVVSVQFVGDDDITIGNIIDREDPGPEAMEVDPKPDVPAPEVDPEQHAASKDDVDQAQNAEPLTQSNNKTGIAGLNSIAKLLNISRPEFVFTKPEGYAHSLGSAPKQGVYEGYYEVCGKRFSSEAQLPYNCMRQAAKLATDFLRAEAEEKDKSGSQTAVVEGESPVRDLEDAHLLEIEGSNKNLRDLDSEPKSLHSASRMEEDRASKSVENSAPGDPVTGAMEVGDSGVDGKGAVSFKENGGSPNLDTRERAVDHHIIIREKESIIANLLTRLESQMTKKAFVSVKKLDANQLQDLPKSGELEELRNKLEKTAKENADLSAELCARKDSFDKLSQELLETKMAKETEDSFSVSCLKFANQKLEDQVKMLETKTDEDVRTQLNLANLSLQQALKEKDDLSKKLSECSPLASSSVPKDEQGQDFWTKPFTVSCLESTNKELEEKVQALEKANEEGMIKLKVDHLARVEQLVADKQQLQQSESRLTAEKEKLAKELETERIAKEEAVARLNELRGYRDKYDAEKKKVTKLETTKQGLVAEIETLKDQVENIKSSTTAMQQVETEHHMIGLREQNEKLLKMVNSLKSENGSLASRVKQSSEITLEEPSPEEASLSKQQLSHIIKEKENDLKEAEKKSEMQKKVSQSTVAKLKEKKKELENEKELSNTLKLEVSVLKSRLDKTDASDLNSKLCDRLGKVYEDFDMQKKESDARIKQVQTELDEKNALLDESKTQVDDLADEMTKMQAEIDTRTEQLEEKTIQINDFEEAMKTLFNQDEEKRLKIEATESHKESLMETIKKLKQEKQMWFKEINSKVSIQELEQTNKLLKEKSNDLDKRISSLTKDLQRSEAGRQKREKDFCNLMETLEKKNTVLTANKQEKRKFEEERKTVNDKLDKKCADINNVYDKLHQVEKALKEAQEKNTSLKAERNVDKKSLEDVNALYQVCQDMLKISEQRVQSLEAQAAAGKEALETLVESERALKAKLLKVQEYNLETNTKCQEKQQEIKELYEADALKNDLITRLQEEKDFAEKDHLVTRKKLEEGVDANSSLRMKLLTIETDNESCEKMKTALRTQLEEKTKSAEEKEKELENTKDELARGLVTTKNLQDRISELEARVEPVSGGEEGGNKRKFDELEADNKKLKRDNKRLRLVVSQLTEDNDDDDDLDTKVKLEPKREPKSQDEMTESQAESRHHFNPESQAEDKKPEGIRDSNTQPDQQPSPPPDISPFVSTAQPHASAQAPGISDQLSSSSHTSTTVQLQAADLASALESAQASGISDQLSSSSHTSTTVQLQAAALASALASAQAPGLELLNDRVTRDEQSTGTLDSIAQLQISIRGALVEKGLKCAGCAKENPNCTKCSAIAKKNFKRLLKKGDIFCPELDKSEYEELLRKIFMDLGFVV